MKSYLDGLNRILTSGVREENRTGIATYKVHGVFFEHNMAEGFPILTTKQVFWKSAVAETLGFIKGFDNAAQFRGVGSRVWDANANETGSWLASPHRKGVDDLGRIYGVQMRGVKTETVTFDQLEHIIRLLRAGIDDRRLICDYWNWADVQANKMALPPCHHNWQVGIIERDGVRQLDLHVQMRSQDVFLGEPYNLVGYGALTLLLARLSGLEAGRLFKTSFNYHIYENHLEQVKTQLRRIPYTLPTMELADWINPQVDFHEFVERVSTKDFNLVGYQHHPAIHAEMAA